MYVEATGHSISPKFVAFYQEHGGNTVFGNPLSEEMEELCEDNVNRPIQYFERAVLEYHDNVDPSWQVMGRQSGKAELARRHGADMSRDAFQVQSGGGEHFVAETGHTINAPFLAYFEENGGVRIFGYPLTEAFFETGDDGVARTVQYFERAVLQYHDDESPAVVRPRALGVAEIASTYGDSPGSLPPFQARNPDGSIA